MKLNMNLIIGPGRSSLFLCTKRNAFWSEIIFFDFYLSKSIVMIVTN